MHRSSILSLSVRTLHTKRENGLRVWKNSMGLEENPGRKGQPGSTVFLGKPGEEGRKVGGGLFLGKAGEEGERNC